MAEASSRLDTVSRPEHVFKRVAGTTTEEVGGLCFGHVEGFFGGKRAEAGLFEPPTTAIKLPARRQTRRR